jgi:hypothetical protein
MTKRQQIEVPLWNIIRFVLTNSFSIKWLTFNVFFGIIIIIGAPYLWIKFVDGTNISFLLFIKNGQLFIYGVTITIASLMIHTEYFKENIIYPKAFFLSFQILILFVGVFIFSRIGFYEETRNFQVLSLFSIIFALISVIIALMTNTLKVILQDEHYPDIRTSTLIEKSKNRIELEDGTKI